jgi:hypothetical protein
MGEYAQVRFWTAAPTGAAFHPRTLARGEGIGADYLGTGIGRVGVDRCGERAKAAPAGAALQMGEYARVGFWTAAPSGAAFTR